MGSPGTVPPLRTAIVHATDCRGATTLASARIARWLHSKLPGSRLVDFPLAPRPVEALIVVNSPWAFCEWRDLLADWVANAGRLVWVQNDYALPLPKVLNGRKDVEWWTTVPDNGIYVNWNALTYEPIPVRTPDQRGLLYWGAFRDDRLPAFRRYFAQAAPYHVTISTSARAATGWKKNRLGHRVVPAFAGTVLLGAIARWPATVYLEDEQSHRQFHSLANRAYEAVAAGTALYVDAAAVPTWVKAGIRLPDRYVVRDQRDVHERLLADPMDDALHQRIEFDFGNHRSAMEAAFWAAAGTLTAPVEEAQS